MMANNLFGIKTKNEYNELIDLWVDKTHVILYIVLPLKFCSLGWNGIWHEFYYVISYVIFHFTEKINDMEEMICTIGRKYLFLVFK